jgi:hypothetical protein
LLGSVTAPGLAAGPSDAAPAGASAPRFEVSVGYLGRSGEMTSGDDASAGAVTQFQCTPWPFGMACGTVTVDSWFYENEGYRVAYEPAPRVSARWFPMRHVWVGLSLEDVRGTLSANLDSNPAFSPADTRYALGRVEGQRVSFTAGLRGTWSRGTGIPIDYYGGASIDLSSEKLVGRPGICASGSPCGTYRVHASTGPGQGLLVGGAIPLTRALYLAAELTLHSQEWDFTYEYAGGGTDSLGDAKDHLDQSDTSYALTLSYRL